MEYPFSLYKSGKFTFCSLLSCMGLIPEYPSRKKKIKYQIGYILDAITDTATAHDISLGL